MTTTPTQLTSVSTPRPRFASRLGNGLLGSHTLLVYVFLYLPVIILVIFSFNNTRSVAVLTGFSLEWYARMVQNTDLLQAARNSLIVGITATVASTALGTIVALGMDRYRFRMRTAVDANLYLPIVIPEIVMGISLLLFFNQALFPLIRSLTGYQAATGLHTITISHIAFDIPFVYVIVRARLADFDRSLEEAAKDLGADEWQTFRRVTLPLLMPGIVGGALLAFTLSLDDYLITVFTKGVQSQTMPLYIYSLVRRGVTPEINALSTALLLGSITLVGLSLTAQAGGPLYTRSLSFGAMAGLGFYGAAGLLSVLLSGSFSIGSILIRFLFMLSFLWIARRARGFYNELSAASPAGKIGALLVMLLIGTAVFISLSILL